MTDLPGTIDQLGTRPETLERRVFALEHPSAAVGSPATPEPGAAAAEASNPFALAGGVFQVLGNAMLGIAGAYLLRAVAESSLTPKPAVAAFGIAYAILWLVGAVRTRPGTWFVGIAYACTSALILAPMLWELTLRFKVLPAAAAAGALAAFTGSAFALTWKRDRAPVLWVASVSAAALAVALAIASREMVPFIAVLVFMVLLWELGAAHDPEHGVRGIRMLAAAAADFAIWLLIYVYSGPRSAREDYPALGAAWLVAPGLALFLIYAASITLKTALRGKSITGFETIQAMIAFLLAASSLLYFGPPGSATIFGIVCMALAGLGYASVFALFDRAQERRNYRVFSTWSAALFLAGSLLCLPPRELSVCLGAAAIAATIAGARLGRLALEFHGALYLLAGAAAAGLLGYVFGALAGGLPGAPSLNVCLLSACAVLCYAAAMSRYNEAWKPQVIHLVFASLAAGAAAALLVGGLAGLAESSVQFGAHHLAFIRTMTLCAVALALAFGGSRWRRLELTRIGYGALAMVAVKLVAEDMRLGHLEYIAASIFLFALTLITVPRVARTEPKV